MVVVPIVVVVFVVACNIALYLANENSALRKCFAPRGRLLAITNRLSTNLQPQTYWAWDVLDPNHAVQAVVPRWMLLLYRCATLCLFGFTIMYQGVFSGYGRPTFSWLIYYTNWTFVGFGFTALPGIAVLVQDMLRPVSPDKQEWTTLRKICLLSYIIVGSSAIFLTLFYWAVDYDGEEVTLDNVLRHGINVIVLIGEMLMNRLPVVTYHFQTCFIYGTVYLIYMWSYHEASGDWVYSSLNWNRTSSLIFYGVVPLMLAFGFGSLYGLAIFRERVLLPRAMGKTYTTVEEEIQLGEVTVQDGDAENTL